MWCKGLKFLIFFLFIFLVKFSFLLCLSAKAQRCSGGYLRRFSFWWLLFVLEILGSRYHRFLPMQCPVWFFSVGEYVQAVGKEVIGWIGLKRTALRVISCFWCLFVIVAWNANDRVVGSRCGRFLLWLERIAGLHEMGKSLFVAPCSCLGNRFVLRV